MDDYISISEFAKIAGLSRQTVYLKLDKDLHDFVKIDNGKKKINVKALELFNVKFDMSDSDNFTKLTDKDFTKFTDKEQKASVPTKNIIDILTHQIDILTCQIDIKDKQLAEKDKQLNQLTELLKVEQQSAQQAQALHAGTIKQTALIESDSCKNSFWTRLFRRSEKK